MAIYKVLDKGEEINRIVADAAFAESYAAETGYTLELASGEETPPAPEPPVTWEAMAQAIREGVNSL